MPSEKENTDADVQRESTVPGGASRKVGTSGGCPNCGGGMNRKMFRTGSTQHPGRDMQVCPRCGCRR